MISLQRYKIAIVFFLSFLLQLSAQQISVSRIEPGNWWVNMKHNRIQLMVYGENLSGLEASFNTRAISVKKIHQTPNPSYAFIDIEISPKAAAGSYVLTLKNKSSRSETVFPLLQRKDPRGLYQGFSNSDIIYLITPDRFADGDTTNNMRADMIEKHPKSSPIGRHGGDLQGLMEKLDYIRDLGITALWVSPLVENNTEVSYHGYGITDHYRIDPRFGTNEMYKKFVAESHSRGMKVILDHVNNHIGLNHPWSKILPTPDWYNGTPANHEMTRHYNRSVFDLNSPQQVRDNTAKGWFVDEMPDLNQKNPYVQNYLIQNTIWWIEFSGLDGIREDTYVYNDLEYQIRWEKEILNEYPSMNIVGEVWIGDPVFVAAFQKDNNVVRTRKASLPALIDFPFRDAITDVLSGNKGIYSFYEIIAKDMLYGNPENLVTFVDNHDISRLMYIVKNDLKSYKLGLQILMTMRGIPQIYYGTELGITGKEDHGSIRENFTGGFPEDPRNAFTRTGRTDRENEIYDYLKKLIGLRRNYKALSTGKLYHYPPVNEVYSYFRISDREKIFVVINNSKDKQQLDIQLQNEFLSGGRELENLLDGSRISLSGLKQIDIEGKTGLIFLVK